MKGPVYQRKWPLIIAMQGEPYSGKTEVAYNDLGVTVTYPIIRLDDILDGLSPTCPPNVEIVMSQAFDIITCMVKRYTSRGRCVIIDSPLSRRSHLDKLVSLLTSANNEGTTPRLSLVIIECKPRHDYWREIRFVKRDRTTSDKWYKPQDWPPHSKFTGRDYTDNDIPQMVSKLVLDTSKGFQGVKLFAALHHLTTDLNGKVTEFLHYQQEYDDNNNPHRIHVAPLSPIEKMEICRSTGHVLNIEKRGTDNNEDCRICGDQVVASSSDGGVYSCTNCSLVIHKSCAERGVKVRNHVNTFIFSCAIDNDFPVQHKSTICEKFSKNCPACLLESNMKCPLLPTVVHHRKHSHHLQLTFKPSNMGVRESCEACWSPIGKDSCFYGSTISSIKYHTTCLMSPPFMRDHKHCGYTHDLELLFERDEELADYLCHLCFTFLLPYAWYYRCKECCLDLHIECAFQEFK